MAIADFLDCLPDTIGIEPYTGLSTDGLTTRLYGASVPYPCRIEMGSRGLNATEINILKAKGILILGTTDVIDKRDRLTLPTGFLPAIVPIVEVRLQRDEDGPHHTELLVGEGRA